MGGKYAEIERYVHRKVNTRREDRDRDRLEGHPKLIDAAQSHARDMAKRGFYSHTDPDGTGPGERIPGKRWSENINKEYDGGRHPSTIAENAVASWMQSAGHRRNILNREFSRSGVGVWKRGEDVYLVQVFAASVPDQSGLSDPSLLSRLF